MDITDDTGPLAGPVLVLRIGPRRIVLAQGVNRVGRDAACDVHLNDASVSRMHARLSVSQLSATVEDLGSKNGTWVQGVPIHDATEIADGDELMFGAIRTRFMIDRPDTPTTHEF